MQVVFNLIEGRSVEIVSSDVLSYESSRNPYIERRQFVESVLSKTKIVQPVVESIVIRAHELEKLGLKAIDALHLACAEHLLVDYFVTCDDALLHKYRGPVKAMNPVDFYMDFQKGQ